MVKKLYFKKQLRTAKGSKIKTATFIVMPSHYGSMKPKGKKKKKGRQKIMGYTFKVQTYDESKPKVENCEVKPKATKKKSKK